MKCGRSFGRGSGRGFRVWAELQKCELGGVVEISGRGLCLWAGLRGVWTVGGAFGQGHCAWIWPAF